MWLQTFISEEQKHLFSAASGHWAQKSMINEVITHDDNHNPQCRAKIGKVTADKTERREFKKYIITVKRRICDKLIREQKLFLNFLFQSLKVATLEGPLKPVRHHQK